MLLVVVYHFWPGRLTGGYIGVDVFFVISGFLITQQLARQLERTDRIALPSFYARQDTMTPLIASLTAIAINVGLKIGLTGPYGVTGLALATAIGQWVNLAILVALAWRRGWMAPSRGFGITLVGVAVACAALTAVAVYGMPVAEGLVPALPHLREVAVLGVVGSAGAVVYAVLLLATLRIFGLSLRRR